MGDPVPTSSGSGPGDGPLGAAAERGPSAVPAADTATALSVAIADLRSDLDVVCRRLGMPRGAHRPHDA